MARFTRHAIVAGVAAIGAAAGGCGEKGKSDTMAANDVSSAPAAAAPAGATGKLAEFIAKAAGGDGPGPHVHFQRGHEMSGITDFDVSPDGAFALTRSSRKGGPPQEFRGQLDASQRQALYAALAKAAILSVPSSTRPIGDDEQPIVVSLDGAGQTFTLRIWAADARDSAAFGVLAAALYPLLERLSAGGITLRP